jgi:hypothetical protein
MSGTGVTYYDEKFKHLFRLLKALPDDIPSGNTHDFIGYIPDPEETKDFGSVQSVVSHLLGVSFAADSDPTGKVGSVSVAVETIATSRDGIDITAPFFRDLLADSPVQGADAIWSLADWPEGSAGSSGSAKTATGNTSWDGEAEKNGLLNTYVCKPVYKRPVYKPR